MHAEIILLEALAKLEHHSELALRRAALWKDDQKPPEIANELTSGTCWAHFPCVGRPKSPYSAAVVEQRSPNLVILVRAWPTLVEFGRRRVENTPKVLRECVVI